MPEDRYASLGELPFPALAEILEVDLAKFRERKNGSEWAGPCPVHHGKRSNTAFGYSADGKWHCFSCSEKGKGAIDLAMKVRGITFQAAVDILQRHPAHQKSALIRPTVALASSCGPSW